MRRPVYVARLAQLLAFAAAGIGAGAAAAGDQPLLSPGQPSAFDCDTEAFGMDFTPFKQTTGTIRLTVTGHAGAATSASDPNAPAGNWTVNGPADTHVASVAKLVAAACASGCPVTMSPKGEAMLWSPGPKTIDKLGETETLTIAVIRPEPLSVSISTFRGRDIVALEKGPCRKADAAPAAQTPAKPN